MISRKVYYWVLLVISVTMVHFWNGTNFDRKLNCTSVQWSIGAQIFLRKRCNGAFEQYFHEKTNALRYNGVLVQVTPDCRIQKKNAPSVVHPLFTEDLVSL